MHSSYNSTESSLIMNMEDVPDNITDWSNLLNSNPTPPPPSPQKMNIIRQAALDFIPKANEKTVKAFASLGEKIAGISGKVCKDVKQQVTQVFETIYQYDMQEIKNSNIKRFGMGVNSWINKFAEKAQSIGNGDKKPIGNFTSKILNEKKQIEQGKIR